MLVWFCHSPRDVEPWGEVVGAHADQGLEGTLGHRQSRSSADLTPSLEDALRTYQITALTQYLAI